MLSRYVWAASCPRLLLKPKILLRNEKRKTKMIIGELKSYIKITVGNIFLNMIKSIEFE